MRILAFDIGGTKIASAVVSVCGKLLSPVVSAPTPKDAGKIEEYIKKRLSEEEFDGAAVATAGVVYNEKLTAKPHNLPVGYENICFHKLTAKPLLVENDANAALWAEYKIGVLKGTEQAVMLTLGTGVGCGIICGGRILRGKTGAAGEQCPVTRRDRRFATNNGNLINCIRTVTQCPPRRVAQSLRLAAMRQPTSLYTREAWVPSKSCAAAHRSASPQA